MRDRPADAPNQLSSGLPGEDVIAPRGSMSWACAKHQSHTCGAVPALGPETTGLEDEVLVMLSRGFRVACRSRKAVSSRSASSVISFGVLSA